MNERHVNTFEGGWNTDDELTDVPVQDFVASINTRRPLGSGGREVIPGNTDLGYVLPGAALDTQFLGYCEDPFLKTGVMFVKNATADRITRHWPEEARFDELIVDNLLNFDNPVHSATVVDGKYLVFTDGRADNGVITGNPPRYIDMEKASLYQKQLTYELHTNGTTMTGAYNLTRTQLDGTVITGPTLFYTGTGAGIEAQLDLMVTALNALGVTAVRYGKKLFITVNTAQVRAVITSTTSDIRFVPINSYPKTLIEPYISLARYMPKCAPMPVFFNDPSLVENKCFGFNFQFRYRYIYRDGYKSKWSPISYVPTNFVNPPGRFLDNSEDYNSIRLTFDDDVLLDANWRSFIPKMELAVSFDKGVWRSIEVVDLADANIPLSYVFVNSGTYPVVPSDETGAADVQALGNQEFVPKLTSSIESVSDDSGNYVVALYGNLDGDDPITNADATIATSTDLVDPSPVDATTDQSQTSRKFKEGGMYDIYVVYEDDYGRQWPATKIGRFTAEVSTLGEPVLRTIPEVTINHRPPLRATRWRFAISDNLNQSIYVQFPLERVIYWVDPGTGEFTSTTYGAGDADYVGFTLGPVPSITDKRNILFDQVRRSMQAEDGDRVQVYGLTGSGYGDNGNYRVAGYNLTWPATGTTDEDYTIFVKFDPAQPDHTITAFPAIAVLELYRQAAVDSLVINELPDCYDIVDAGLPTRNHGAAVEILWGDAFERSSDIYGRPWIEVPSLYQKNNVYASDQGRAVVEDPDYSEVFNYNQVRTSGIFIPDTAINGLPSFKGLDYIKVSREIGLAQKLEYVRSILLAIGQYGSHPIYVGSDQVIDFQGNSLVGISQKLLNLAPDILMYGTHDPLSIVNTGQYVIGWDGFLGTPWIYSVGGGIDPIPGKNVKYFNAISKTHFANRDTVIVRGGHQREFGGVYYLTFKDTGVGYNETLMFSLDRKQWEGNASFVPELYGTMGLKFYTFSTKKVWQQETGTPGTFFGTAGMEPQITFVANSAPRESKLFWNINQQSDQLWWGSELFIPNSTPGDMLTRIKSARWKRYEGHWIAAIPRDMRDPNPIFTGINGPIQALVSGRKMRGDVIKITLRLADSTKNSKLRSVSTEYSKS